MMAFRLFVTLATLLIAFVHVSRANVSSACYGTTPSCDFYSMECASQQIIRVNNLYAGYKNLTDYPVCGTEQHCSSEETCCVLRNTDISEEFNLENTYNTYTNCSGRQSCTAIHAPWQLLQATNDGFTIYSSFVHLEYDCQEVSSKIPLCGGSSTTRYAEIMFDGSVENFDPLKASKECRCSITNIGQHQNIIFTTIDVRLESYYKRENQTYADCSSAHFTSYVYSARCVPSEIHYKDNFFYKGSAEPHQTLIMTPGMTSEISLTDIHANGRLDSPAMVWIAVQADEDKAFTVSCEEIIPAQFITTTSTTTSTTTTATTTTPKPTTTTTTTTPKPTTTTTTTTQKPTTTTTTTTPKPTITTTTTTPKPTTTTTTTTQRPTTTFTTTTQRPTTTSTTMTPTLTTKTTTTTKKPTKWTTKMSGDLKPEDGESDRKQRTAVYLAIIIPIIVCLFSITAHLIFWKRQRRKLMQNVVNDGHGVVNRHTTDPRVDSETSFTYESLDDTKREKDMYSHLPVPYEQLNQVNKENNTYTIMETTSHDISDYVNTKI